MFERFVVFHELLHFGVASVLSVFLFWKFHSLKIIMLVFLVTFLLDLDHLFDYFYFAHNLNFWEYFGKVDFFIRTQKSFVFAHSWELVIFLGAWGWFKKLPVLIAISLAIAGHLLVDQFTYTSNPLAYFLFFRALNDFGLSWFNGL